MCLGAVSLSGSSAWHIHEPRPHIWNSLISYLCRQFVVKLECPACGIKGAGWIRSGHSGLISHSKHQQATNWRHTLTATGRQWFPSWCSWPLPWLPWLQSLKGPLLLQREFWVRINSTGAVEVVKPVKQLAQPNLSDGELLQPVIYGKHCLLLS